MLRLQVRSDGLKLEDIVYGGGDEKTDGSVEVWDTETLAMVR